MKPFHFYVDSDEEQSTGNYKLIIPYCRNSNGYGIFYFFLDKMGEITSGGDFRGKGFKIYFESSADCVKNFDNNMGRWGKNKLQELAMPKYIKAFIVEIFINESLLDVIKMWN